MKVLVAVLLLAGFGFKGEFRLPTAALVPVINAVTVAPSPAEVGTEVSFSVDATGGAGLTYQWDFGDGNVRSYSPAEASIAHTYLVPGHFKVRVNVLELGNPTPTSVTKDLIVHFPVTAVKPTNSSTIILDAANQRVWCVNPDSDTVSAIDSVTNAKLLEVSVGRTPKTLAQAADGRIWVVSAQHPSISILHPLTGALEHVVPLPHGSLPYGVCMTPDGGEAFVSFQGSGGVQKFSTSSREVLATSSLPPSARGIAVSATGRVFVTRFLSQVEPPLAAAGQLNSRGEVVEFNTNLGFVRTIKLQLDPGPDTTSSSRGIPNYVTQIMITPDGRRAWVPSKKDNIQKGTSTVRDGVVPTQDTAMRTIVSAIDLTASSPGTDLINERVDTDNSEMAQSACTSPLGDYIFIGIQGTNKVMVRDLYKNTASLNGFGSDTTGLAPQGLVFDAATNKLFVQNFMSRDVTVFDTTPVLAAAALFSMPVLAKVSVVAQELLPNVASVPPTTAKNDILRGKKVFYNSGDTRMSQEGYISCAGCHLDGGSDARVWDFTNRGEGLRNTTMLQGRGGTTHGFVHWSANFDEIQDFENDIRNAFGGTGFLTNAQFTATSNPYTGGRKAGLSDDLDAMAAYVTSLTKVARSPFRQADGTLTASGARGEGVFRTQQCATCHGGPRFSDSTAPGAALPNPSGGPAFPGALNLHNVGTLKSTSGQRLGGGAGSLYGIDTPTLKGIWQTAPYFHDGSAATIEAVISTIPVGVPATSHGSMHTLSAQDKADLAEYLREIDELDAPPSLTPFANLQIRSLTVSTGKPYSLATPGANAVLYVDRSYTLPAPPATLVSPATLLRTAEDDKNVGGDAHVTFEVTADYALWLYYDSRATVLPSWLNDPLWARDVTWDAVISPGLLMNAYRRNYLGGTPGAPVTVTLGGNQGSTTGALRNYFVAIYPYSGVPSVCDEGPIAKGEWAHDQDGDGDGLRDEFEVQSALSPWLVDTASGTLSDEDKLAAGGGTFFAIQPAQSSGGTPSFSGGGGGCGLLGLEYLLPLLALRLRRRRRV